jgi:hypothetical protein
VAGGVRVGGQVAGPERSRDVSQPTKDGGSATRARRASARKASIEPHAENTYEQATARFAQIQPRPIALHATETRLVRLANECLASVASDNAPNRLTVDAGFHERRHFYFTNLMFLTGTRPLTWMADHLLPRAWRRRRLAADIRAYAVHLIETNAMRVESDLRERVLESRRWLERQVLQRLEEAVSSGERAMVEARERYTEGAAAVRQGIDRLEALRARLTDLLATGG